VTTDASPAGPIEDATGELVDEVFRFVRLLKAGAAKAAGQEQSSMQLLWPLLHEGPLRLRELAAAKGVDQSTVSRQAAQLVHAGLIRREPDPGDRRAHLHALTDRGRAVCREVAAARRQEIASALADWDTDRIVQFVQMFRDFNHAVEKHSATSQEIS
jgi:DNA-binding MarR family transcriptional regulator